MHRDVAEEFEDGVSIYTNIGSMFSSNRALSSTFGRNKKKKEKKEREPNPTNDDNFETVENSEDSADLSSLLTAGVQLLDGAMQASGSEQTLQTYGMIKSMMAMWNPQASRWAANASAVYK